MSTTQSGDSVSANKNKYASIRLLLLIVVPGCLLVFAAFIYLHGGRYIETDNAYVKADIVPISARVAGTVANVLVVENQPVSDGDLLFVLDAETFQLNVDRAKAKLGETSAQLQALRTRYLEKQANIALEEANTAYSVRELNRQKDLKGNNFVSESTLDNLEHRVAVSQQTLAVMQLELHEIVAALGGDASAPLEQHPSFLSAQADLHQAQYELKHTAIRAPNSGIISRVPKVGQFIKEGNTISALVVNQPLWIEANFPEKELTHVKPGQTATIKIDTYPGVKWQGDVESISPATGAEFSLLPPQNATGNWVKIAQRVPIRIKVNVPEGSPALRVGLSAIVEIDTQHRRFLFGGLL